MKNEGNSETTKPSASAGLPLISKAKDFLVVSMYCRS